MSYPRTGPARRAADEAYESDQAEILREQLRSVLAYTRMLESKVLAERCEREALLAEMRILNEEIQELVRERTLTEKRVSY